MSSRFRQIKTRCARCHVVSSQTRILRLDCDIFPSLVYTLDESLVHSSSLTYGTKLRLVQNSFEMDDLTMSNFGIEALHAVELPFTECYVENFPSSLSSPLNLQAGSNLSTRPSEICISGPENVTQLVKMDKETGFKTLELEQQKGLERGENLILTHRFSICLHMFLSHLK